MRRSLFRKLLCALVLGGVWSCGPEVSEDPVPPPVLESTGGEAAPAAPPSPPRSTRGGGFRVVYTPVRDEAFVPWERFVRDVEFLERIAADLNRWLAVPASISLTYAECGEANAFYRPDSQTITMCYELLEQLAAVFADSDTEAERTRALLGAASFLFYHELGHALIHVLDLPALGREEDSADQLAVYMLADGTAEGERAALDGAVALGRLEAEFDDQAYADEHSLGVQRFYNVACWVYGQDPERHGHFLAAGTLPPGRAERCPSEYAALESSWERLLEPFARE